MTQKKTILPGALLCLMMAAPAWFLGQQYPMIGSPVFGMLMGMIMVMIFPNLLSMVIPMRNVKMKFTAIQFEDGVKYTSKKILQYSIILLGFGMNLFHVLKVGSQSLFIIGFTLTAAFFMAFFMGKVLKLDGKMVALIGVGTSICGGSAIAATAPVIRAKDEDVAHAISTIFLFNIIAVFIFPPLGHILGMSDIGFGMWAGTAINDTSSVVAAGAAWSNAAGNNTALAFATIVKLTRTLMIVPITLVLAIYTAKIDQKNHGVNEESRFSVIKVFPWFVIGFVVAAIINTVIDIPWISDAFVTVGKFMIVMAMSAIGLHTNIKKLISNGLKPIMLGLCCWLTVASVSLLVQAVMRIW